MNDELEYYDDEYWENDLSTKELSGEFQWDETTEHNYNYFNNYN